MTSVAIVFVIIRTSIQAPDSRIRTKIISTACVYLALLTLIAMAITYHYVIPDMYEVVRVAAGEEDLSAHFVSDADFYLRCQFGLIVLFWTSVWAVKFSILAFYRSLFDKLTLHATFLRWSWWGVLVLTASSYLGCWATQIVSCWPIWTYFHIGNSPLLLL